MVLLRADPGLPPREKERRTMRKDIAGGVRNPPRRRLRFWMARFGSMARPSAEDPTGDELEEWGDGAAVGSRSVYRDGEELPENPRLQTPLGPESPSRGPGAGCPDAEGELNTRGLGPPTFNCERDTIFFSWDLSSARIRFIFRAARFRRRTRCPGCGFERKF